MFKINKFYLQNYFNQNLIEGVSYYCEKGLFLH